MWWWETQNSYISIGQAHCQHMGMIRMNINTYNTTLGLTKIFWIRWILQRKYTNTTVWSRFLIIKVVCIKREEKKRLKKHLTFGILQTIISFSSSNTQFYESRIFCLLTFWVFFPDNSFKLISKYTQKCQYNLLY